MVEIFSVIIASTIFIIGLNSKQFTSNSKLMLISIAYLLVAVLDVIHLLTYEGNILFEWSSSNIATQYWISARYVEAISLLIYVSIIQKKHTLKYHKLLLIYFFSGLVFIASINWFKIFPECYIPGQGLTLFKIINEYIIILILIITIIILRKQNHTLDDRIVKLLSVSIFFTIISEYCFTLYTNPYGFFNSLGHIFKVLSFVHLYFALVKELLTKPYQNIFKEYNASQERLIASASFLSTLFHDLKNPLTTIRALAHLGYSENNIDKAKDRFIKINEKVDQLSKMLNEVLMTFRQEKPVLINPGIAIEEVIKDIKPVCETQNIILKHNVRCQSMVLSEINLFKRAMYNILNNAIQAIEYQGQINIEVSDQGNNVLIEIKDTGVGIPDDLKEDIFKPFTSSAGTGLGLYMVKYTIDNVHNGKIWFESDPGKGTSFYIKLPAVSV